MKLKLSWICNSKEQEIHLLICQIHGVRQKCIIPSSKQLEGLFPC